MGKIFFLMLKPPSEKSFVFSTGFSFSSSSYSSHIFIFFVSSCDFVDLILVLVLTSLHFFQLHNLTLLCPFPPCVYQVSTVLHFVLPSFHRLRRLVLRRVAWSAKQLSLWTNRESLCTSDGQCSGGQRESVA